MADSAKRIGEGIAGQLGIELCPSRPPMPASAHAAVDRHAAGDLLAEYVGLPRRSAQTGIPEHGIDRAVSIADRVAAGSELTDEDCTFLWSDPQLIPAFNKRLDLERAILAAKARAQ